MGRSDLMCSHDHLESVTLHYGWIDFTQAHPSRCLWLLLYLSPQCLILSHCFPLGCAHFIALTFSPPSPILCKLCVHNGMKWFPWSWANIGHIIRNSLLKYTGEFAYNFDYSVLWVGLKPWTKLSFWGSKLSFFFIKYGCIWCSKNSNYMKTLKFSRHIKWIGNLSF